jgi:hypothetical protein
MPRRNNAFRRPERPESSGYFGLEDRQSAPDGDWLVRPISGAAAAKTYRCPGCDQEIPPGVPHLVAWQADRPVDDRRHWHKPCWNSRATRRITRRR